MVFIFWSILAAVVTASTPFRLGGFYYSPIRSDSNSLVMINVVTSDELNMELRVLKQGGDYYQFYCGGIHYSLENGVATISNDTIRNSCYSTNAAALLRKFSEYFHGDVAFTANGDGQQVTVTGLNPLFGTELVYRGNERINIDEDIGAIGRHPFMNMSGNRGSGHCDNGSVTANGAVVVSGICVRGLPAEPSKRRAVAADALGPKAAASAGDSNTTTSGKNAAAISSQLSSIFVSIGAVVLAASLVAMIFHFLPILALLSLAAALARLPQGVFESSPNRGFSNSFVKIYVGAFDRLDLEVGHSPQKAAADIFHVNCGGIHYSDLGNGRARISRETIRRNCFSGTRGVADSTTFEKLFYNDIVLTARDDRHMSITGLNPLIRCTELVNPSVAQHKIDDSTKKNFDGGNLVQDHFQQFGGKRSFHFQRDDKIEKKWNFGNWKHSFKTASPPKWMNDAFFKPEGLFGKQNDNGGVVPNPFNNVVVQDPSNNLVIQPDNDAKKQDDNGGVVPNPFNNIVVQDPGNKLVIQSDNDANSGVSRSMLLSLIAPLTLLYW